MKINKLQKKNLKEWQYKELRELLDYEQPTDYIVTSENYNDKYSVPVLTAGKTFVLGYTNEDFGIYKNLPVIIFDDFTTANKFVDFPFKVKSSAMKILKSKNEVNIRFIYGWMQSHPYIVGEHKRNYLSEYQYRDVYLPSLSEQNRIVAVLETWDKAIEKLSKKIKIKKQIKKSLMQNLLTGKKRLKGFNNKWKRVMLDDVMSSFSTGLNPRDNFKLGFGNNYYVTIKNISNGFLDFSSAETIDDLALKLINKRSKLSKNDIIMSSIGNVGESYLLIEDPKGWDINESVFCLKPNTKIIDPKFLYFIIINSETRKYFESNITGSSFKSIKMKELKRMPLCIPEILEQKEISKILIIADNEIQETTKKLEIIKDQKKYLLNNLITGTIRTPENLKIKS